MNLIAMTPFAKFAALAIGTRFWFRQNDFPASAGEKPVEALKVNDETALIVNGEFGWSLGVNEVHSAAVPALGNAIERGHGFYYGWIVLERSVGGIWTSDPTKKKARAKRIATSLTGRRFTLISIPVGMEQVLTTGMKGTMLQTGQETPSVVFDNHPTLRFIHTSHMGIHKPRAKMTMAKLPAQTKEVLSLLRSKGSLTAIEAGGVIRARSLSKRVSELKEAGVDIQTETKFDHTGQRYARYHLIPQAA